MVIIKVLKSHKVFKKHNIRLLISDVCISNIFIICPPVRTYVYNIYL